MSAPHAIEAVGAVPGALATLQALAESLAVPPAATPGEAATAQHGEQAQPPGPATASELAAQATQGRAALGQLAAEPAALRPPAETTPALSAVPAWRGDALPQEAATPRAPDTLAVPALPTALHTLAGAPPRPALAAQQRRVARRGDGDAAGGHAGEEPADGDGDRHDGARPLLLSADACDAAGDADADAAVPPLLPAQPLIALLRRARRADALAELQRGRRVLVVLPAQAAVHGLAMAQAWLVAPHGAQRHAARWWPGAAHLGSAGWLQWRVFRDGDPLLSRGLHSRAGGVPCRVRLGAQPQRLLDTGAAALELPERLRFAQALGGLWSLLVLAAPAGTEP